MIAHTQAHTQAPTQAQPKTDTPSYPLLLADIGGTNARFAIETAHGELQAVKVLPCAAYPSLEDALHSYLHDAASLAAGAHQLRHAGIAIANPIHGDQVRMTNHHWEFSISATRHQFGLERLDVVNDFTALALSLPHLQPHQYFQVGGHQALAGSAIGLLGAGTGLGVSGLIPAGERWLPLHSEGGHASFTPANAKEVAILEFAWREFPHVSAERLLSGPGLVLIYRALAELLQAAVAPLEAPDILQRGLQRECAICSEVLSTFCEMLGTMAANLAVTLGARAGIYIGGGIVPRLGDYLLQSGFRARFEDKGRFRDYLAAIPVYVITEAYPALIGLSALHRQQSADR
ncbi:glucokinase [Undibacterium sp. CY7W]|uniref:Glucokinase n=2 Tax=Undibacterium rugosum TaxID=2762291 RepID=A0A923HXH1_9BURK|nr:glucokinase [Undibacterium rugosum]